MPDVPEQDQVTQKRAAAIAAVREVEDGMRVGLGTGSTVAFAIPALAERVARGLRVTTVATSAATERAAVAMGLTVVPFDTLSCVDLGIDGADEIDGRLRAIKGGGAAMLRKKIVAQAASRMIAIVDAGKQVARLGRAIPIEVLPFAQGFVSHRLEALGGVVARREGGPAARSDQGYPVLDCRFPAIDDPERLAAALASIPGLLAHGLFLHEIDVAYVGRRDGVVRIDRPSP